MTAKPKANKDNNLIASGILALLTAAVVGVFGSPWLVEYFKKSPTPESTPNTNVASTQAETVTPASASAPSVVEEQCLKKAWDAFNATKYESAIKFSEQCIDSFGKAADRAQEKFDNENAPLPPTGKVNSAEKDRIFKQGLLNDVATAYFIKGRSAEYLYKKGGPKSAEYKDMAKEAYEATCRYKHARTWDPKGWFWSPCEAASDRLPLK